MQVIELEDQNDLVETSAYPYAKFPFEKFNPVQSRICEIFKEDCNLVVAAKTSAGKTICSEIMMAEQIRNKGGKVMYLAPLKALAKEKIDDWTDANHHFSDLKLAICTGDYVLNEKTKKDLEDSDVIIMTSEMLNSKCRNYKSEKNDWLKEVKTLVIDEFHLLTVPGRGDHLEVGLMKFAKINPDCRIVGLSATMPNVYEISEWLAKALTKKKTYLINSKYRPCPLSIHYEEYEDQGTYEMKEDNKIDKAVEILRKYKDDKFLVFVHSKNTGQKIKKHLDQLNIESELHNADLEKEKRNEVENKFKNGSLRVIIATSTLAWGCYEKGTLVLTENGIEYIENILVGDSVMSMTENGFKPCKVLRTGIKKVKKTIEITLNSGENFKVSEDHKFFGAVDRKTPDYFSANKYKIGDYIATPAEIKIWDDIESDDYGYLVGYVMGDGCKSKCGKYADKTDKVVMDIAFGSDELNHCYYIKELFKKTLLEEINGPRKDSFGVFHLVSKKRKLVDFFNCFEPGRNKHKMDIVSLRRKDPEFLKGLIQGLFDTDGGFSSHGNGQVSIEFSSISKKLVQQVQQILLFFGVRSCVGRKKMKDVIIKERLQKSRRDYIYRVRIYNYQIINFIKSIGFRNKNKKSYGDYVCSLGKLPEEKDIIPVRNLIIDHFEKNKVNLKCKFLKDNFNVDLWNCLNKQDLKRSTCRKITERYPIQSSLTNILNSNIKFSKIINIIYKDENQEMYDIEVDKYHNYVGGGVVSHNCNFPARRVVITGVHRGTTEVDTYDIMQMAGRAGRVGYDPKGDVYVLVPDRSSDHHIDRLSIPQEINSQLLNYIGDEDNPHYKTLAFHLVSEIHHGEIKTIEDIHNWYERSLARFQAVDLDDSVVDKTLELLMQVGAIKEVDGIYEATSIGKVSSMFYYSPFDVSDLRRNFRFLFMKNLENNDYALSMALGNIDSIRMGFVTKNEKEEMSDYLSVIKKSFGDVYLDSSVKGGYAYFCLLRGKDPGPFNSLSRGLQLDFERAASVLNALDNMAAKWNKKNYFKTLSLRIAYGVRAELVNLCKIPNIGKARAEKLYAAGFRVPKDLVGNFDKVKQVLNMKEEKILEIIECSKNV
jgi:replicative superfamily II helicase